MRTRGSRGFHGVDDFLGFVSAERPKGVNFPQSKISGSAVGSRKMNLVYMVNENVDFTLSADSQLSGTEDTVTFAKLVAPRAVYRADATSSELTSIFRRVSEFSKLEKRAN